MLLKSTTKKFFTVILKSILQVAILIQHSKQSNISLIEDYSNY